MEEYYLDGEYRRTPYRCVECDTPVFHYVEGSAHPPYCRRCESKHSVEMDKCPWCKKWKLITDECPCKKKDK